MLIFGCTDLRIGASEAKFDARLDFEVYMAAAPQKPYTNFEQLFFLMNIFVDQFLFGQQMRCWGLSEAGFGEVWSHGGCCLRSEQPFEVLRMYVFMYGGIL